MATTLACPECGTPMREIVWGYGTIPDVLEAGDVVIGGCVVDVDDAGRVAALQCPICGTRADAEGVALARPEPAAPAEHPFAVSFSSPPRGRWEVTMSDPAPTQGAAGPQPSGTDAASPFVDEDFGGAPSAPGTWRDRVQPYSSHEDELPPPSAPTPDHVEPYASREDALPVGGAAMPDRVEPYAARAHDLPAASAPAPDHVEPYASREDALPDRSAAWQERIPPFSGGAGDDAAPGEAVPGGEAPGEAADDEVPLPLDVRIDPRSLDTSDFTDAEEEGWPPRGD